jgi:hypothetical protein
MRIKALFYIIFAAALAVGIWWMFEYHTIQGIVSDGRNRIPGAVVRIQATTNSTVTDTDGKFRLWMPFDRDSVIVTAWKDMFFINGRTATRTTGLVNIRLRTFTQEDNTFYEWVRPHHDPDQPLACQTCHEDLYQEWLSSTHARSATNPVFLQTFLGTDADGNPGVHPGAQLDHPGMSMPCGGCHMPTAAIEYGDAYVVSPGDSLFGADLDGVHCDYCHKIVKAYPNAEGNPGALSVEVMRPSENSAFPQLFVGSLDDVVGRDTYLPLYTESLYCAPCHHHIEENGILAYPEYSEWLASPYNDEGIECQDCHMKPSGKMTNFAPARPGMRRVGVERDPMTIPTHHTPGVHDSTFLASAVDMRMDASVAGSVLNVEVSIANVYGGHHVPSGTPERNMLLLVKAVSGGQTLNLSQGSVLPDYAGLGTDATDYAGTPGKGFARVMMDSVTHEMPVGWWRNTTKIYEDTRIPARETDLSRFSFELTKNAQPVTVTATLIFRKHYKAWADAKKWEQHDMLMAQQVQTISP